jgi:hypothetical protein
MFNPTNKFAANEETDNQGKEVKRQKVKRSEFYPTKALTKNGACFTKSH